MVVTKPDLERWGAAAGRTGIYLLVFRSGACYVGASMDLDRRIPEHLDALAGGRHESEPLQAAFDREGADNMRVVRRSVPICTEWELLVFERVLLRDQVLKRGVEKILNGCMPVIVRRRAAAVDVPAV